MIFYPMQLEKYAVSVNFIDFGSLFITLFIRPITEYQDILSYFKVSVSGSYNSSLRRFPIFERRTISIDRGNDVPIAHDLLCSGDILLTEFSIHRITSPARNISFYRAVRVVRVKRCLLST